MAVIPWALIPCASEQPQGSSGDGHPYSQRTPSGNINGHLWEHPLMATQWEWPPVAGDAHPLHSRCLGDAAGTHVNGVTPIDRSLIGQGVAPKHQL